MEKQITYKKQTYVLEINEEDYLSIGSPKISLHKYKHQLAAIYLKENKKILLHRSILRAETSDIVVFSDNNYLNCKKDNLILFPKNKIICKESHCELIIYSPKYGKKEIHFDKMDMPIIQPYQWSVSKQKKGDRFYCQRYSGIPKKGPILMHSILMGKTIGLEVDHIDHNGLNNRRSNLRLSTSLQNSYNKRRLIKNKTGFKGVFYNKKKQ